MLESEARSGESRARRSPRGWLPRCPLARRRAPPGRARRARRRRDRGRRRRVGARGSDASSRRRVTGELDHGSSNGVANEERRQAPQLPLGKPRADEDAVGAILAELDRRPERVERRDDVSPLVRHQQLHDLEPALEALRNASAKRVEALAGLRRDLERAREAVLEPLRVSSSTRSILLSTSSMGSSAAPISAAPSRPPAPSGRVSIRRPTRRRRGARGRR